MLKKTPRGGRRIHKPARNHKNSFESDAKAMVRLARALPLVEIKQRPVADLKPDPRNARKHSEKQIARLASAIKEFGFLVPIILDGDGSILAGHARVQAAKIAGLTEVPCIVAGHLSGNLKRAFILAENRLAELAEWDEELLKVELSQLVADLDFNIELTGFDTVEVDNIVLGDGPSGPDPDDEMPPIDEADQPVTCPGTCWQLGPHRLYCGDALEDGSYEALLGSERAGMVFADPPYNVPIVGHASGLGRHKHEHFAMASGEMSQAKFRAFLGEATHLMARHSRDGALHFICMDWRHIADLMEAAGPNYDSCKNMIVWVKSNGGMGSFYRSRHELIAIYKVGTAAHINNFGLGEAGRYRTNVWEYAGVNTFRSGRNDELAMHPTVKPVALVSDAIRDCSRRNDIILDSFGGSGTTLIAAHRTGRIARLIELDPRYCDVAVRRWQKMSGLSAVDAGTGESFDDLATRRTNGIPNDETPPPKKVAVPAPRRRRATAQVLD